MNQPRVSVTVARFMENRPRVPVISRQITMNRPRVSMTAARFMENRPAFSMNRRAFVAIWSPFMASAAPRPVGANQLTARVPFDDRRALGVPIEKLRESKVRECYPCPRSLKFLSDIRSGLLEEKDARQIYRRMFISARVKGDQQGEAHNGIPLRPKGPGEHSPGPRPKADALGPGRPIYPAA